MVEQSQPRKKRRCLRQDWSQLPAELVELILKKLPTIMDILTFKAVCSPWRSTVKSYTSVPCYNPPHNPCLMFQANSGSGKHEHSCLFDLVGKTVYKLKNVFEHSPADDSTPECLGSTYGWLTFKHPINRSLSLYNPVSGASIQLPPLPTCYEARKVIVSADPSSNDNFNVGIITQTIALFCNNGVNEWRWLFGNDDDRIFEDIMFHKEHLYAVSKWESSLTVWDCRESPPALSTSMSFHGDDHRHSNGYPSPYYLVVSKMDEILLVVKTLIWYPYSGNGNREFNMFDVQKLDKTRRRWEKMENLGEETLFVASDQVTSLRYKNVSGCEENSVYYFDSYKPSGYQRQTVHDANRGHAIEQCKLDENGGYRKTEYQMKSFFDHPDLRGLSICTHQKLFWFTPTI